MDSVLYYWLDQRKTHPCNLPYHTFDIVDQASDPTQSSNKQDRSHRDADDVFCY